MLLTYLKRYRSMILASIFFFYMGCGITLSLLHIDCADAILKIAPDTNEINSLAKTEYAVLILSSPANELRRDAIRATWKNFAANIIVDNGVRLYSWNHSRTNPPVQQDLIKFYFVIGTRGLDENKITKLQSEHSRSDDLLLLHNLEDNYKNLTTKMLKALKWFIDNMRSLKYIVKCDDDSFVRVDLIVQNLEAFAPEMSAAEISQYVTYKNKESSATVKGLYWGYFNGRARVYLKGKWQEKDWFMCDNYLPYALGGGYVISRSIVEFVVRNADFLSHYNSEDVSMGVWTAPLDGINRVHDIRFDTEWQSRGCNKQMLVRHKQSPENMFQMYRTLVHSQGDKLCSSPVEVRKSYFYKWDLLPSQCCRV